MADGANLVFPLKSSTPADALCGTHRIDFSPDGRYLAAYSKRGFFPFRHATPNMAVLDVDCLVETNFSQSCVRSAFQSNAPVREAAWAANSKSIVTLAPEIAFRSLAAPAFSPNEGEALALKSAVFTEDLHLDGHAPIPELKRLWPRLQEGARATPPDSRPIDVPITAGNSNADGLYLDRQDYTARLKSGQAWRTAPISGAAAVAGKKTPPRLLRLGGRKLVLAAGELIDVESGATIAKGGKFKLRSNGELSAVFDDLDAITELSPGSASPVSRPIDRRPDEALVDFSRAEKRSAAAYHYEAPYGNARIRLEVDGRSRELVCPRAEGVSAKVEMRTVQLGSTQRPLAATLFTTAAPKGLIVYAPGGPGAPSAGASRAPLVEPFVAEGWDVLMVVGAGNSGAGRATVDRLARDGGSAIEADADAILAAMQARALGDYRRTVFYGESYGGLLGLATLNRMQGRKPVFDRFLLAAPWLKPKPPASWADTRGPQQSSPARQAAWERAAMGIDWTQPSDAFRRWAEHQRATLSCSARVAIFYSRTDPTFEPGDLPCRPSGDFTLTTKETGSHMVALAGVQPWIRDQLATIE